MIPTQSRKQMLEQTEVLFIYSTKYFTIVLSADNTTFNQQNRHDGHLQLTGRSGKYNKV